MKNALAKAHIFYFEKFLPSVLSCMLITPDSSNSGEIPLISSSSTKTSLSHYENPVNKIAPAFNNMVTTAANLKTTITTVIPPASNKTMTSSKTASTHDTSTFADSQTPITSSPRHIATTEFKTAPMAMSTVNVTIPLLNTADHKTKTTPLTTNVATASLPNVISTGPNKLVVTPEITGSHTSKSLSLNQVFQELKCKCHYVHGDGSCLYHAVAHQAGFIDETSKGDIFISGQLRQPVFDMMVKHPGVREEDGLSVAQWLQRMMLVNNPST